MIGVDQAPQRRPSRSRSFLSSRSVCTRGLLLLERVAQRLPLHARMGLRLPIEKDLSHEYKNQCQWKGGQ